jgi:hypothetical protein
MAEPIQTLLRRAIQVPRLTLAVAGLVRASTENPALRPIAVAANVDHNLPSPPLIKQKQLLRLFLSPAATAIFENLNPSERGALAVFLNEDRVEGMIDEDGALADLVRGILEWENGFLRSCLECVIDSWGLPDLLLAIEHEFWASMTWIITRQKGSSGS